MLEEGIRWFLTQGVLGATTLLFALVSHRLWNTLESCRRELVSAQKENADQKLEIQRNYSDAQLATLERVLSAFNANTTQLASNTKAIELALNKVAAP